MGPLSGTRPRSLKDVEMTAGLKRQVNSADRAGEDRPLSQEALRVRCYPTAPPGAGRSTTGSAGKGRLAAVRGQPALCGTGVCLMEARAQFLDAVCSTRSTALECDATVTCAGGRVPPWLAGLQGLRAALGGRSRRPPQVCRGSYTDHTSARPRVTCDRRPQGFPASSLTQTGLCGREGAACPRARGPTESHSPAGSLEGLGCHDLAFPRSSAAKIRESLSLFGENPLWCRSKASFFVVKVHS